MAAMVTEPVDTSRVTVVHNAHKQALGALRFAERLRARGIDIDVVVSDDEVQGDAAARRALDAGATLLIASGGDGTVRSVLSAVIEARATLGTLPLGTSNDLSVDLGVRSVDAAVEAVLAARARDWDAGACAYVDHRGHERSSVFCSTAGVGVVARALSMAQTRTGSFMKRALGNGVWPPLITASAYLTRAHRCVVSLDDTRIERTLMLFEISKLRAAGGIALTPDARGDSGILHAWAVEDPRLWELAGMLYDSLSSSLRQLENKHVEYFSRDPSQNRAGVAGVTRIAIDGEQPLPLHLNGDYVGTTPAVFEVRPSAFRVLVAPGLAGEVVRVAPRKLRAVGAPVPMSSMRVRSGVSRA